MTDTILQQINQFIDPASQATLQALAAVAQFEVLPNRIDLTLRFGFPTNGYYDIIYPLLQAHLSEQPLPLQLSLEQKITGHKVPAGHSAIPGVKNMLAVYSAKGGVGKSTIALNMALALQAQGARVGLVDADIYGPSLAQMLASSSRPETQNNQMLPVLAQGLQTMSMGYLTEETAPVVWRGPMATRAVQQLITETLWQDVDYLVIDMPPGTGDIQLTLAQKVPINGAIMVTTPQAVACLDAVKGLQMFRKVNIPVLGLVENMRGHTCPHCQQTSEIFGQGGGEKIAEDYQIPLLGSIPLDGFIRETSDNGQAREAKTYEKFSDIARACAAQIALQSKTYQSKFPKIVVENS